MEISWKVLENLRIVKFPKWKPFNRKFQKLGYAWRGGPLFYEKFRKLKPKFSVESKALIDTVDTITYYRKKKRSPLCRLFVCQFSAYCFGPFHTISWHWKGRSHFNLVCPLWLFPIWFHSDKSLCCVFESRRILIKKVNSVLAHVVHSTEPCLGFMGDYWSISTLLLNVTVRRPRIVPPPTPPYIYLDTKLEATWARVEDTPLCLQSCN